MDGITISWVKKECAWQHHSLAHELGHNFGCHHDVKWNREKTNEEFPYGHGYTMLQGPDGMETAYGSIMAENSDFRLNQYSNPRKAALSKSKSIIKYKRSNLNKHCKYFGLRKL